jgi:hypothetical protein
MIIYKSTVADFRNVCFTRSISFVIQDAFRQATQKNVGQSEINSWSASLQHVAIALNDKLIPHDAGVAVEYTIPQSSKRMDFIISGYGDDQKPALIIMELTQWSSSKATGKDGIVLARRGGATGETEGTHPSYQAWSYAALLKGFNEAVYSSEMDLRPCAYLHNHLPDGTVDSLFYKDHIDLAPLFLQGDSERDRLRRFIAQHVTYRAHAEIACPKAKTIKRADLIDNTRPIVEHDREFARVYLA